MPETEFLAPDAPFPCDFSPFGYQWFSANDWTSAVVLEGVKKAAQPLNEYIDHVLASRSLPANKVALLGFSQGTMMALHIGLRRPRAVAAVVGYSGMLAGTMGLASDDLAKPPVLLVHGTADPVVPIAALHMSESELKRLGVEVTTHISYGVAHSVDPVGLRLGRDFVSAAFDRTS